MNSNVPEFDIISQKQDAKSKTWTKLKKTTVYSIIESQ